MLGRTRTRNTPTQTTVLGEEEFRYSYAGRMKRAFTQNLALNTRQDWFYRHNASGDREQKRLYDLQLPDSNTGYGWAYYLLDGNETQLALYHGQQGTAAWGCGMAGRRVHMYPVEYLTYGLNDIAEVSTRPDKWAANGLKEYKVVDHLGSTRIVLDGLGGIVSVRDYTPFGEDLGQTGIPIRRSYIDKETDVETGLGAYGARSYIAKEARFGSIDPKWEQFRAHSPYHYSFNNPVLLKDPSGKNPAGVLVAFAADYAFEIGLTLIVTGAIVHHVTQTEYVGTNRELSTSVAGPIPQRHFPLNPGLGKQLLHSLSSIDLLNFGTALQAMSESYGDDGPEEPAGDAPAPPVGGDAGTPDQTNPFAGPVTKPVIAVDPNGNAIPVQEGEKLVGSPDGRFIQVRGKDGKPNGIRIDGPHNPAGHPDPRSLQPHGHIPGLTNPDGTPWLPIKF
jgi:RHS repeat-associated protein